MQDGNDRADMPHGLEADEIEQITRAAWHYYNDALTQNQIADILGLSRIKVSRLLERGRQSGLIELKIHSPFEGCLSLQRELCDAFNLIDARVVPEAQDLPVAPRIGRAAASLLSNRLRPGGLLAIGWGEATTTTLQLLGPWLQQQGVSMVSLTGGVSAYIGTTGIYGPQSNAHLIPTPLRVSSPELAAMLRVEPYVRQVLDMAVTAQMALIGVWSLARSASLVRYGYCSTTELELFSRMGAVGDVLGYFYDENGQILALGLHEHVIAVSPKDMQRIPAIIATAAGPEKVAPMLGMMRGKLCNIVVTDESTARALLART